MASIQQAVDSTTFAAKVAGFGAFGLAIEQITGYPVFFWVSATIGALLIRQPFSERSTKGGVVAMVAALAWSWMATAPTLDFLGLSEEVYLAPVAGFWAGFGEYIGKLIRDPDKLGAYVGIIIRGRQK